MNLPTSHSVLIEDDYLAKFTSQFVRQFGLEISIPRDYAGIDKGLLLYTDDSRNLVSNRKIWFQFKSIERNTKTTAKYDTETCITAKNIKMSHIKYWGTFGEPVFLVVYSQNDDKFYYIDTTETQNLFSNEKRSVNIKIEKKNTLNSQFFVEQRSKAPSVRADSSTYAGKILAINLDPLRSCIKKPDEKSYIKLVDEILHAHNFVQKDKIETLNYIKYTGCLFQPIEIPNYWTIEFGTSDSPFRNNGEIDRVDGNIDIYVISNPCNFDFNELPANESVVFYNCEDKDHIFGIIKSKQSLPISNNSITYLIVLAPLLFNTFRTDIKWQLINPLLKFL